MADLANSSSASKSVLIAASGSGGHLVPAVLIAKALKELEPGVKIRFLGAGRPLEEQVIGGAGFEIEVIKIVGVKNRGLRGVLQFLSYLPAAWAKTGELFKRFEPDVVIGVGGYVSVLPVTRAFLKGIPTWIHEAELAPGLANSLLSLYATRVSKAFKEAKLRWWARGVFTGHPVRDELKGVSDPSITDSGPRRVLVLGGSQGARALDETLPSVLASFSDRDLEVRHQCREENVDSVKTAYEAFGVRAEVEPFIHDMASAYQWSELVISRAGAGAVMEIGVVNRPAVLVPFPYAQGNHQYYNARVLADAKKAMIVEEGDGFEERLRSAVATYFDLENYRTLVETPFEGRVTDAAQQIAREALGLIR